MIIIASIVAFLSVLMVLAFLLSLYDPDTEHVTFLMGAGAAAGLIWSLPRIVAFLQS